MVKDEVDVRLMNQVRAGTSLMALIGASMKEAIIDESRVKVQETRTHTEGEHFWCVPHQRYCKIGGRKHRMGMKRGHVQRGGQPY